MGWVNSKKSKVKPGESEKYHFIFIFTLALIIFKISIFSYLLKQSAYFIRNGEPKKAEEKGIDQEWLENKKKKEQEAFSAKAKHNKFSLVEIVIACQNLPSQDTFSAADPLIAYYTEEGYMSGKWILKGMTEALRDTPNPIFQKSINMAYYYDTDERIKIELYDVDNFKEGVPLEEHTYLAE